MVAVAALTFVPLDSAQAQPLLDERDTLPPPVPPAPPPPPPLSPNAPCPAGYVRIPAGTFRMGSPDGEGSDNERPAHDVQVAAFCMQKTEVTVDAYAACVSAGGCTEAREAKDATDKWDQFCNAGRAGRGSHPINCVYWNQAMGYCQWRGGRLPTEEEWEYAARGTDGRQFPWGNQAPSPTLLNACGDECAAMLQTRMGIEWAKRVVLYSGDDGFPETAPVGSFPAGASPFGVLDMAGNVSEWTASQDCSYPPRQLCGGTFFHISRGGSWGAQMDFWRAGGHNMSSAVRVASRGGNTPKRRDSHLGFRCAR